MAHEPLEVIAIDLGTSMCDEYNFINIYIVLTYEVIIYIQKLIYFLTEGVYSNIVSRKFRSKKINK